jgi:hypothetical protein
MAIPSVRARKFVLHDREAESKSLFARTPYKCPTDPGNEEEEKLEGKSRPKWPKRPKWRREKKKKAWSGSKKMKNVFSRGKNLGLDLGVLHVSGALGRSNRRGAA